jgi:hypothetical protein
MFLTPVLGGGFDFRIIGTVCVNPEIRSSDSRRKLLLGIARTLDILVVRNAR